MKTASFWKNTISTLSLGGLVWNIKMFDGSRLTEWTLYIGNIQLTGPAACFTVSIGPDPFLPEEVDWSGPLKIL